MGNIPDFLTTDRDTNYNPPLYVTKVVTKVSTTSKSERIKRIHDTGFNVFALSAEGIAIDLLTDSGTGSISDVQLSKMMLGDEAYAGSSSFYKMSTKITGLTGLKYVVPTHQGRGAERVLNYVLIAPAFRKEQSRFIKDNSNKPLTPKDLDNLIDGKDRFFPEIYIPGNTHFDTTAEHINFAHGTPKDFTIPEGRKSDTIHPFKGNLDVVKLTEFIKAIVTKFGMKNIRDHISYVIITVTCNSGGGQPVSMKNIREISAVCKKYNLLLFFDAARYAENAFFIKEREKGYANKSIKEIIKEMFSYVDGCTMSAKKDAIVPMGGFIALRDKNLYEELANVNILFEGFKTYGGMSGLMMEALAEGLEESSDDAYLKDRIELVRYLGNGLKAKGIPIVEPIGGHAVFVDARKFYKGIISEDKFPAQALTAYLYIESGIRAVEIGSSLKGRDPKTGENIRPDMDLMRLTIPRRRYSKTHMDCVINALDYLYKNRTKAKGLEIIEGSEPKVGIRHFSVKFRIAN